MIWVLAESDYIRGDGDVNIKVVYELFFFSGVVFYMALEERDISGPSVQAIGR